jgi:hypothetical protein
MPITRNSYRDRIASHKLSVLTGMQRIADMICRKGIHHDDDKL